MEALRSSRLEPFLKWPGGKRWIKPHLRELVPTAFSRYFEPFLGGGALYFNLRPDQAHLSDVNEELVNVYGCIKHNWRRVLNYLHAHQTKHDEDYYYSVRETKFKGRYQQAARTLYLNRTCWNGLYRLNLKGVFNVPIGTKSTVILPTDDFAACSLMLSGATIEACDFESAMAKARTGDFVFVDPPYTVKHNANGFVKYNEKLFSWDDQIRLRNAVERAVRIGAKVLVANANHHSIHEIYEDLGTVIVLDRISKLAADPKFRSGTNELFIRCWDAR